MNGEENINKIWVDNGLLDIKDYENPQGIYNSIEVPKKAMMTMSPKMISLLYHQGGLNSFIKNGDFEPDYAEKKIPENFLGYVKKTKDQILEENQQEEEN